MIPWIQVYSNLVRHPKVTKLADKLGLTCKDTSPNVVAAGMLVSLWLWASQNATNGDLSDCSDRAIAEAAEYRKKPSVFVEALIDTKFLDKDRKLHDWNEYAELLIDCQERQREQTRKRVAKHRAKKKAQKQESCNDTCNYDCNVTDTQSNAPTIPNHTVPNLTIPDLSGGDGDITRAGEASEKELASIGLKPGEFLRVTPERVEFVLSKAEALFDKYRHCAPEPWDCRKVFIYCAVPENSRLLEYAFETAAIAGKVDDWRYIDGIMERLMARDIHTPEAARQWDADRPDITGAEELL